MAVARLLPDATWRRHLASTATDRGLRQVRHDLYEALARCTGRPWLADWLTGAGRLRPHAAAELDPLEHWLARLDDAAAGPQDGPPTARWDLPERLRLPGLYSERSSFLTDVRPRHVVDQAHSLALTGGWHP
ncbi:hypothetical protein ACWDQL_34365 [Streptomyces olivaceus]